MASPSSRPRERSPTRTLTIWIASTFTSNDASQWWLLFPFFSFSFLFSFFLFALFSRLSFLPLVSARYIAKHGVGGGGGMYVLDGSEHVYCTWFPELSIDRSINQSINQSMRIVFENEATLYVINKGASTMTTTIATTRRMGQELPEVIVLVVDQEGESLAFVESYSITPSQSLSPLKHPLQSIPLFHSVYMMASITCLLELSLLQFLFLFAFAFCFALQTV